MTDLGRQIRTYFEEVAPPLAVDDVMNGRARDLALQDGTQSSRHRFVILTAAVVLVLLIGVLVMIFGPRGVDEVIDSPSSSTTPPTTVASGPTKLATERETARLSTEPPEVGTQRVTSTVLGDVQWRLISGSPESMPAGPIASIGSEMVSTSADAELITSEDGTAWERIVGLPAAEILAVQDTGTGVRVSAADAQGRPVFWTSSDLENWDALIPPAVFTPNLGGAFRVDAVPETDVEIDGVALSVWKVSSGIDWSALPPDGYSIDGIEDFFWGESTGRLSFMGEEDGELVELGSFDLVYTGTPENWRVEIVEVATDSTVGFIDGSSPGESREKILEDLLFPWAPQQPVLVRTAGGVSELVDITAEPLPRSAHLVSVEDSFVAYLHPGPGQPGPTEIHRSIDGRVWQLAGLAPWSPEEWMWSAPVEFEGTLATVLAESGDVWWSTDGLEWKEASTPPEPQDPELPGGQLVVGEQGFFWFGDQPEPFTVAFSTDGDEWVRMPFDTVGGDTLNSLGLLEDGFYTLRFEGPAARLWIGTFEP